MSDVRAEYEELKARGLKLDLTRGKPASDQLDLSTPMLSLPGTSFRAADGTDTRNYGGLNGLAELRALFSGFLQVPASQIIVGGNSSLALMHDAIVHSLLGVPLGAIRGWAREERVAFLAPVPGYDRHFALCERFGIELIPVPMTPAGPDMDEVERLVAADPAIKGIWCVPKYSNPDGTTYSAETVARLAAMPAAAPDFRIFWDNAYAVHHLFDQEAELADVLALATEAGNADRVFVFGSTSKVTLAGAGVSFFGGSPETIAWFLGYMGKGTIGADKVNQLRHVEFLRDENGLRAHMRAHADLIRPKFEAVDRILSKELSGLATWSSPLGGYFISLTVPEGCAKEVVRRAAEAGIALTPAGATHPYGQDPTDSVIRIAPTFPGMAELEAAISGLAVCVRLVAAERA
ncbi:aminotransferase class I/II-fold pyridoxal phosphate-dependent enzyme [Herbidospora cretacea]|uniref:aminotransferase class I/II-fold pyridoxal phosphate-dependent enzyme n=1 Tax=Herbidospora cretacea TaxID=28444 RepID=UPI000772E2FC|nr:aminotransferase class I/II-fold pyridoxal phosphate-dependent enzyme [Herbidospora cretacea]